MIAADPFHFEVWEDTGFSMMSRIISDDGSFILQEDLSSINYDVYDLADPNNALSSGSLTITDVIFDTLQTDVRWDADATGYNFRFDALATLLPRPARYHIDIKFTPTDGEPFHAVFRPTAKDLLRS